MKRPLLAAVAVVALIATTAGGCNDTAPTGPKGSTFDRDCKARGGHVQKTQHGRICAPPVGGWQ